MSTSTQLAMTRQNLNDAWWCEALFASGLQPSDAPTAEMVAAAINRTLQQLGVRGCVGQMAQEFGDHPDAAARRMRWVHGLTEVALALTQAIAVPQAATTMAGSVRLSPGPTSGPPGSPSHPAPGGPRDWGHLRLWGTDCRRTQRATNVGSPSCSAAPPDRTDSSRSRGGPMLAGNPAPGSARATPGWMRSRDPR
jgi:hypothetical protein